MVTTLTRTTRTWLSPAAVAQCLALPCAGNEAVLRARFEDAQFFYNKDRQHALESFRPQLGTTTFQQGLGSMLDKSGRVERLAGLLGGLTSQPSGTQLHNTSPGVMSHQRQQHIHVYLVATSVRKLHCFALTPTTQLSACCKISWIWSAAERIGLLCISGQAMVAAATSHMSILSIYQLASAVDVANRLLMLLNESCMRGHVASADLPDAVFLCKHPNEIPQKSPLPQRKTSVSYSPKHAGIACL